MKVSYQQVEVLKPQKAKAAPSLPINLIIFQEYNNKEKEPLD